MFENLGGGTLYNPIWDIWSDVQTRVGTPHKILRCLRSRGGTPHIPIWDIWSDVQTRVGTQHISIKVIWSDVHTRVGTLHKVLEQNVKLYPGWVVAGT